MSLTTNNGKMAVMDWQAESEPGLLISVTSFDTAEQQGLIWGIPEVDFNGPVTPPAESNVVPVPDDTLGAAGGWSSKEWLAQKKKRKEILAEDDEIMAMCMAALPELLEKFRNG